LTLGAKRSPESSVLYAQPESDKNAQKAASVVQHI
jgi:hypothetical protein